MAKDGRKRVTRQRILESALCLFAQRGFKAATTRAIADGANVGKSTIHLHFGSKEDLFAETVGCAAERFLASMKEHASMPSFQSFGAHWVAVLCDDTKASGLLRPLGGDRRNKAVLQVAQSIQERFVEFWCEWLRQRETDRSARPAGERVVLAHLIVSSLAGIALMTSDPGDEMSGAMLGRLALMVDAAEFELGGRWAGMALG